MRRPAVADSKRWLLRGLVAVAVWAGVTGFAELTDRRPHLLALAGAVAAVVAVGWLCTDTLGLADAADWSLYRSPSPDRSFDPRFSRLSQELAEATDRRTASAVLHASLVAVADQILFDRYDVDRARQPVEAKDILGERATAYLAAGPGAETDVSSPRVSHVLDRLESL